MANLRIAKFITEVAPPQYISVMRHRASKMMDTINEEEKDVTSNNCFSSSPGTPTSASTSGAAGAASSAAANSQYFSRRIHRSFSIFES
ncbi:uncharacterized protein LOC126683091 [Mercurialis annua]|uniref:uncharacterized protein LOC126683091 n=1 Tax=Mercurialis annua TaxID=3986 RepID=UPI0024ACA930|nr:uncharacterized protein LOC126683091 [Mercurialis annua]